MDCLNVYLCGRLAGFLERDGKTVSFRYSPDYLSDPEAIIRAYATYSYDGDMTKITDPFFDFPFSIDNAALGASPLWPEVRNCPNTHDCRRCGKCDALLEELKAKSAHKENVSTTAAFVKFFKG